MHPVSPVRFNPIPQPGPRFRGRTRQGNTSRKDWPKLLPRVPLNAPVAAVDLGGNGLKAIILEPDYTLHYHRQDVISGQSIGKTGAITRQAWELLREAIQRIAHSLQLAQVAPENVRAVATAGLRSAANGQQILAKARKEGIPFHMIDFRREAALIYPSVLTGEGIRPDERMLVIEIGGGSTELALGTGPERVEQSAVLELGTGRLNLKAPFNYSAVQAARKTIRQTIRRQLEAGIRQAIPGRRVFIKASNLDDLADLHRQGTGEDLLRSALTHKQIRAHLTRHGLSRLEKDLPSALSEKKRMKLVAKLLILDELMRATGIPEVELGFDGGLKFAVLRELLLEKAADGIPPPVPEAWTTD